MIRWKRLFGRLGSGIEDIQMVMNGENSDLNLALVERFQNGDAKAFDDLIVKYQLYGRNFHDEKLFPP